VNGPENNFCYCSSVVCESSCAYDHHIERPGRIFNIHTHLTATFSHSSSVSINEIQFDSTRIDSTLLNLVNSVYSPGFEVDHESTTRNLDINFLFIDKNKYSINTDLIIQLNDFLNEKIDINEEQKKIYTQFINVLKQNKFIDGKLVGSYSIKVPNLGRNSKNHLDIDKIYTKDSNLTNKELDAENLSFITSNLEDLKLDPTNSSGNSNPNPNHIKVNAESKITSKTDQSVCVWSLGDM